MFLQVNKLSLFGKLPLAPVIDKARKYRLLTAQVLLFIVLGAYVMTISPIWGVVLFMLFGLVTALLYADYIRPQREIENLIFNLRAGSLRKRMNCHRSGGGFNRVCGELNFVAEMLESQSEHVTEQLQNHTNYMAEKNSLLTALYHFTDALSTTLSLPEFTAQIMKGLSEGFDIHRVIIRRKESDGMRLLTSTGDFGEDEKAEYLPPDSEWLQTSEQACRLVVPVRYQDHMLGVCCMYLNKETFERRAKLQDLFTSMGRYIAIAIERQRHEDEAHRFSIMEEREKLAHELHDSLAQTIHSIGYCAHVVESVIAERDLPQIRERLDKLLAAATAANREVRLLIGQFRGDRTAYETGSVAALIEQLQSSHPHIRIHFHDAWGNPDLPYEYEAHIYKIVQEALFNVLKHSQADVARVFMRREGDKYRVLIEDNGAGMDMMKAGTGDGGEHVGISAMCSRADDINGRLHIESEPDEGVHILLDFTYPSEE